MISTGGYHNTRGPAAMDGIGSAWADLCQLAQRLTGLTLAVVVVSIVVRMASLPVIVPVMKTDQN